MEKEPNPAPRPSRKPAPPPAPPPRREPPQVVHVHTRDAADSPFRVTGSAVMLRAIDGDDSDGYRDYEVELSSDFRRPLWGGTYETLVHEKAAVMTDFVDRGMAYLQVRGHWSGDAPGRILEKSVKFKREGDLTKLTATVRIVDDGMSGTAQMKRWDNGINRNLSIDYEWREWVIAESADDDETDIRVEKWRLRGVSVVTDPADEEVGVMSKEGRTALEAEIMQRKREIGSRLMNRDNDPPADPSTTDPPADPGTRTDPPADPPVRTDPPAAPIAVADPPVNAFDTSMAAIGREFDETMTAVAERRISNDSRARLAVLRADAEGRIRHGGTHAPGSLTQEMFRHLATANEGGVTASEEFTVGADGTVKRDASKSTFGRAVVDGYANLGRANGGVNFTEGAIDFARGRNTTRNAGAAMEFHDAMVDGMEKTVRQHFNGGGIMIPPDMYCRMLAEGLPKGHAKREKLHKMARAFLALSGNNGGNLIETDVLVEEFVSALHASAHLEMLGARQIMGLSSNIQIPTQSAKLEPTWITEVADASLIDSAIGAVTSVPHRIAGTTDVSQLLMIQTGGAADDIVMGMLQKGMEENLDVAVLAGADGGNDPTGVINTSGISSTNVPLAAAGAAARYANMVAVKTALLESDVPQDSLKWSVAAEAIDNLQTTPRVAATGDGFVMEGMMLVGLPAYATTILSADTAADKFAICSDWGHLLVCTYGMPILIEDMVTQARKATKRMTLVCFMDVLVTQASRFSIANANTV